MWEWIVYTIRDDENRVVYVGKTMYPIGTRFSAHRTSKKPLGEWIRNRLAEGKKVNVVTEKTWQANLREGKEAKKAERESTTMERALIARYYKAGCKLFNKYHLPLNHNVNFIDASEINKTA